MAEVLNFVQLSIVFDYSSLVGSQHTYLSLGCCNKKKSKGQLHHITPPEFPNDSIPAEIQRVPQVTAEDTSVVIHLMRTYS